MSGLDGASISSVAASLPFSETVSNTLHPRNGSDQALRQKSSTAEVTTVALGYEYAALAIGESSRQVQQAEELQKEREERYASEQRREREAALREVSEQQFGGTDQEASRGAEQPGSAEGQIPGLQPAAAQQASSGTEAPPRGAAPEPEQPGQNITPTRVDVLA